MKNPAELFQSVVRNVYFYSDYMSLMEQVVAKGITTGPKQSPELANYTKLNLFRMQRLNKTVVVNESLKIAVQNLRTPQTWYVLSEAWCGDAAQNLPVLMAVANLNPVIHIKILLRDENPDVMDSYMTMGGRSIPKLIALDEDFNELFTWGPRPAGAQKLLVQYKENPVKTHAEFAEDIQRWYIADKTQSMQSELTALLEGVLQEK